MCADTSTNSDDFTVNVVQIIGSSYLNIDIVNDDDDNVVHSHQISHEYARWLIEELQKALSLSDEG